MDKIIGIIIVLAANIFGNIYWHKKIIDGKWIYTTYTTIILIFYLAFVFSK